MVGSDSVVILDPRGEKKENRKTQREKHLNKLNEHERLQ